MDWRSWLVVGMAGLGLLGCGPEETTTPLRCDDAALGPVDEACGVWVSASLGSDDNPGTRAAPMASLSAAVLKADKENDRVYACGEVWTEPLVLPSGVSLFGGFDCANEWTYGGADHRSRIETAPGQVPLKTEGDLGQMVVSDFRFQAADATEPGGSSIAVIVGNADSVQFRRCTLYAGRGADGLNGALLDEPAAAGAAGSPGADACTTADGPGGEAIETACDPGGSTRGGKGGSGGPATATDGESGAPAPPGDKDPDNPADGDGGKGETAAGACTPGEPGANGADGAPADKVPLGERPGHVSIDGYKGIDGTDGKPGAPGQGGGGGGASRGGAAVCGAATPGGAGGGSGGAGGCGGKGGKGGQAGGSSFAIVILAGFADVSFDSCDFWISTAGDGGDGAPGQPGGPGGEPGKGGAGQGTLAPGCQGGTGGNGGKGGGGRGGAGGHSVYIARRSFSGGGPWPNTTFHGEPLGGLGGDGGDFLAPDGDVGAWSDPPLNVSLGFQQ